jgi:hypothetical protein
MTSIKFRVDPGDVPPEKAARRLHLSEAEFEIKLPELISRGFPEPDPTTGMFCMEAIDEWRRARYPHLFRLTAQRANKQSHAQVMARINEL